LYVSEEERVKGKTFVTVMGFSKPFPRGGEVDQGGFSVN